MEYGRRTPDGEIQNAKKNGDGEHDQSLLVAAGQLIILCNEFADCRLILDS